MEGEHILEIKLPFSLKVLMANGSTSWCTCSAQVDDLACYSDWTCLLALLLYIYIYIYIYTYIFAWALLVCSVETATKIEFRCYEVKIEESEKAGSHRESKPEHLWLEPPVLCHWAMTTRQPPTPTILYLYCTGAWYWLPQSHTWQLLSMCLQNSVRGWPENSLHQERTHAEWSNGVLTAHTKWLLGVTAQVYSIH